MKLNIIHEGIVSAAKGDIVNVKNDIATQIADAVREMHFGEISSEFAKSSADDCLIYILLGKHTILVRIMADDDIQIQVPERLSKLMNIHDYYKLETPEEAIESIRKIQTTIYDFVQDQHG